MSTPSEMRANVSVTKINVDETNYSNVTLNIDNDSVTMASDSDSEVAHIDFKVKLRQHDTDAARGSGADCPRPMSWDGELSDNEIGTMCIDDTSREMKIEDDNGPQNLTTTRDDATNNATNLTTNVINDFKPHANSLSGVRLKQAQLTSQVYSLHSTPCNSPLLGKRCGSTSAVATSVGFRQLNVPPTPSPDSAVHSVYSVFSSPSQSPLTQRHQMGSLSRNNSDASHSSCCSYSSVSISLSPTRHFSPTNSPIQGRHLPQNHLHTSQSVPHGLLYKTENNNGLYASSTSLNTELNSEYELNHFDDSDEKIGVHHTALPVGGISRQQLINSPCPICGDKISGFHYGIFSCESCKGFFKRTVQNRKNYVCLRGAVCPVTVTTRKKCPACRFEKCLQCGMKLEAIREDRTRGGRSTYQCSYNLPSSLIPGDFHTNNPYGPIKTEPSETYATNQRRPVVPTLLQEIMDVEHLWHYNELELNKINEGKTKAPDEPAPVSLASTLLPNVVKNTSTTSAKDTTNPDFIANLCNIADHRLYKIVKWCKSLPLFKNISIDDQICLLINSWCELLLFSCCYRSIETPGEIRVSLGKSINLAQARQLGLQACIERMLNFTEHLRRLKVDRYEYVAMKVIILLTSDTSELREADKVRASQEKALQALQAYTISHYPDVPTKFGELLIRIPELQRTCQVGKEMLIKSKEGEGTSFNLLMELLRGDH